MNGHRLLGGKTNLIPHACDYVEDHKINKIKNSVVWIGKATDIKGFDLLKKLPEEFFREFKVTVVCAKTIYSDPEEFNFLSNKGFIIKENLSEKDYNNLLKESEYVLSTARKEGFCIAVLEAMHYGCIPVVPYWIGGTTDFVNNDNGIVYKNFDECYEKMKSITNKEDKIIKSIETAKSYNWNKIVKQSINVYKELYNEN